MPLPDNVKLHMVDSFDSAVEFMSWLGSRDADQLVATDTESTGLNQQKDTCRLVQLGGHVHGWSIPADTWLGLIREAFDRYRGRWILHNAPFDDAMLQTIGVKLDRSRVHDTRPMGHVLEPNVSTALKSQAARHVDEVAAAGQIALHEGMKKNGWDWATVPLNYPPYWSYGALDTVLTRHLFDVHHPVVQAECPDAYDLENSVQWVTHDMEHRGVMIDIDYARRYYDAFTAEVQQIGDQVKETYNVSAGSNAKIIEILQNLGYQFSKKTASGAYALDKEVIGHIDHPLAQSVLRRRRLQKVASTYLKNFIEGVDANDVLHPSINTLGARTGRMSMSEPNLQNLPRVSEGDDIATTVRNCVRARPGHTLLMCDFDQVEMRLLAWMAQCHPMMDAFRDRSTDFFVSLARQIFGDDTITKKDKRRQITKNAGYAKIYGAGVAKFAWTAGVSEAEASSFLNRFDTLYPQVKEFQVTVDRLAWTRQRADGRPYARSPLTRRYQVADVNKVYALVNFLVQGTAAEVLKMKLLQLTAAGLGEWLVLPVHDEVILDVPNEHVPDAVQTLSDVMNDDRLLTVPLTASVSYGMRWGAKRDWRDEDEWNAQRLTWKS